MKILRDAYEKLNIRTTVALGCFDGVHVAHARVISEAVETARKNGTKALVWCFAEPPKNTFIPSPVPLITGIEEKARLIEELGADVLVCPDFTREIARIDARDFVREILCSAAGAVHLVSGRNYSFGRGGEGNSVMLAEICAELGIGYTVVDDISVGGVGVSSTEIRRAVSEGKLEYAARFLGRSFSLSLAKDTPSGSLYLADPKHLTPPAGEYLCLLKTDTGTHEVNAALSHMQDRVTVTLTSPPKNTPERFTLEFPYDKIVI